MSLEEQVIDLARKARAASERVSELSTREKNTWLMRCAERLTDAKAEILAANAVDLERAASSGISGPMLKRLELAEGKWRDMIAGLRDIAALPDPVGRVESSLVRPNGTRGRSNADSPRGDRNHLRKPAERNRRCGCALRQSG